jgi:hypothetical protein
MKFWMTEKRAHNIAVLLQAICVIMLLLAAFTVVLMVLGRIQVSLTTPEGHFERALLAEKDHSVRSRALYYNPVEDITLQTDSAISPLARIILPLMGLLRVFPFGFVFFQMSRFFANLAVGEVFVRPNAQLLLQSGAVMVIFSVITPILNAFVLPALLDVFTDNELWVAAQANFTSPFFGAVLLVAAYVFHYGIYLQDEADHTI